MIIPHFGLIRQHQYLKDELLEATDSVLESGQLINGEYTKQLEKWICKRTGAQHTILVHSGTQALEFIASYYGRQHKSEARPIISIPNITYPATLNAFDQNLWRIKLTDVNSNGIIDFSNYRYTYTCYVGLFGANTLQEMTDTPWLLAAIIDGAQHWLTVNHGRVGRGMSISFDPTKNLYASGNGGAIVTNDTYMNDNIRSYQDNGKPNWYESGTNSKMSELDCAHIMVRTKYIDKWQDRRQQIRTYYEDGLADLPIRCLSRGIKIHANQKFAIYADDRKALQQYLTDYNIETKQHYPYTLGELQLSNHVIEKPDMMSVSVMLSRGLLSLPMHPELTDAEVETVVDKIKLFYAR